MPTPIHRSHRRGFSRLQLLTGAIGGIIGLSAPWRLGPDQADASDGTDAPNFVATGTPGVGFDASTGGTPTFSKGVAAVGTDFGVLAQSPKVGVRGGGDSDNGTGVLGVSFTDASETTHGSGTGVQGNSGTGIGVAGYSEAHVGVYGKAAGVSGIGVSGSGVTGVSGSTDSGSGVQGGATNGTGVLGTSVSGAGLSARSNEGSAITATSASQSVPAILAQNTGAAGGIQGESGHSFGVLGLSSAAPGKFPTGVGVAGQHLNGYGAGVAGYSVAVKGHSITALVPQATGVFGEGDAAGVSGLSGAHGDGVRGVNTGSGTGVLGESFLDQKQSTLGSGSGVQGSSGSGSGVAGFSHSGTGVYGQSNSVGVAGHAKVGVQGTGTSGSGVAGQSASGAGVTGESTSGIGVAASTRAKTAPAIYASAHGSGPAISAVGEKGYGAELSGKQAPLRLIPHPSQGPPVHGSHLTGEMVVDDGGNLFLCTQSGSPGTWRRVSLE